MRGAWFNSAQLRCGAVFFLFERVRSVRGVFDVYRAAQQKLRCLREGALNSEKHSSWV